MDVEEAGREGVDRIYLVQGPLAALVKTSVNLWVRKKRGIFLTR
jgi:hypothetical protein